MSTKSVKAGYLTISWDEKPVSAEDATIKMKRVRTERKFTGAMEGTGKLYTFLTMSLARYSSFEPRYSRVHTQLPSR
ncbi:hypothetical protein FRC12_012296 [Ceratobasidium sp. 428]|nr:hypothetical protein FRC12_012296 [Ceratobasidium sp. 428]